MKLETGRIVRRVGLSMEAAALIGLMTVSPRGVDERTTPWFYPSNGLVILLGVGFFVWAFGTGVIYRAKILSKRRVRPLDL